MPISDSLIQDYESKLKGVEKDFKGITPEIIQKALGAGGSLSSSLGFNSPFDVMGLTPDQFDQVLANRSTIMRDNLQQFQGAVNLRDQLYGISANRQAAQQAAKDVFQVKAQGELQEQKEQREDQRVFDKMVYDEDHWQKEKEMTEKHFEMNYDAARADAAANMKVQRAQLDLQRLSIASANSREAAGNATQLKVAEMNLAAAKEEKRLAGIQAEQVFKKSTFERLDLTKDRARNDMKSDDNDVVANARKDYFRATMQQESLSKKPGFIMDSKGYQDEAGGWPKLVLGKDNNWYGFKEDKAGEYAIPMDSGRVMKGTLSSAPIVPYPSGRQY